MFERSWDHLHRPFGYPTLAYIALKIGSSLNAVVSLQLVGYLLAGFLVYLVVFITLKPRANALHSTVTGPLFAGGAMVAYFTLSTLFLASAYYVLPEFVSSASSIAALTFCAILISNRVLHPLNAALIAIAASICAAMLISFKPSMIGIAAFTLALAAYGVFVQKYRPSRSLAAVTLFTMISIPSSVLLVDEWLIRKYADGSAIEFGPKTAFCNNAPLILNNLERPGTISRHLLGEDGAREFATFLRDVISSPANGMDIQGFDGDHCMYTLGRRREDLQRKYLGVAPDQVAGAYRRLVIMSILDSPGTYLLRVIKQMKAYVTGDATSCNRPKLFDWRTREAEMHPIVKKLVLVYAKGPTANELLPMAPGIDTLCFGLSRFLAYLSFPIIGLALVLASMQFVTRALQHSTSRQAQSVLQTIGFWLSGAVVVSLVHTFDIQRYITVMFPVYIATLAIAFGYLIDTMIDCIRRVANPRLT